MTSSLRIKWVLLLVAITTICLSVVGAVNYSMAKDKMRSYIEQQNLSAVQDTSSRLSDWFAVRYAEAKVISRTPIIRTGTLEEKLTYLRQETAYAGTAYLSAGIADLSGNLTLTNGKMFNVSDNPAFQAALAGQGRISDPFFGQRDGGYIVTLILPVWNDDGTVSCLLEIVYDARNLFESQLKTDNPDLKDRVILIQSDSTVLYSKNIETILNRNYLRDFPDLLPVYQQMIENGSGFQMVRFQGEQLLLFYAKVPNTQWYLLLYIPQASMEKPLNSLLYSTVGLIALMEFVLASLIYFVFNTMIIRRIHKLLVVTKAVAGGNLSVAAIETNSRDELGLLSVSVNDMTQNLRDLFEPFESFIHSNQLAMIITDSDYRIIKFSPMAETMLGYRARDVIHTETPLLWHDPVQLSERASAYSVDLGIPVEPDCSVLVAKPLRNMEMDQEWIYIRANGTRLPINLNVSPMTRSDGSVKGYVMLARDMSVFFHATETSNRLLHILDAAQDFIASFDLKGNMFYINAAGKRLLGIDTLDSESRRLGKYLRADTAIQLAEGLAIAQQCGHWEGETEFMTDRGGIVTSQVIVAHKPSDGGDPFFSTIVRDIMEQKRTQTELMQAKEDADNASLAKSMFLARMSHEIRTPLNGITGLSYLMQQTKLTDIQRDYQSKITGSAQTLLQVINDVLDFSKIEAKKLTLERANFQLDESVRKLSSTLSVLLGHKPIDMAIRMEGGIPAVLIGDPLRLEQILLNLTSNAIKFTDQGAVTLLIRIVDHKDGMAAVRFAVTDTGIGMTPEQLNRLFQPFMQADESTSRKFGGTGLGLNISKSMIEMMGGTLTIESEPGLGSTFSFTVRFESPDPSRKRAFPLTRSHGDFRILVVEDSPLVRSNLSMMINSLSVQTDVSPSWTDALRRLDGVERPVHALLLDMEAEDMYGEDIWLQMKQAAYGRGALTIAYTTLAGRDALQRLPKAHRPDAILVKPVSRLEMYQTIAALQEHSLNEPASADKPSGRGTNVRSLEGHVLLVEDQMINQTVATAMLEKLGLSVTGARHGLEALELLRNETFDLILMDIHMPELDGLETTAAIRRNPRLQQLPIIALTADATSVRDDQCRQAGMNDLLSKPLEPELLLAVLSKWLPRSEAAAASEAGIPSKLKPQADAFAWAGIDMQDALQRLDGKVEIVFRLLLLFRKQHEHTAKELRQLVTAQQFAEARRLAHSLQGAAGNLGMKSVFEAAYAFELAVEEQRLSACEPLSQSLESALVEVCATIDTAIVANKIQTF
ncbi:response regulator [Paenibacillus piri]|uniref:Circadian input-output histidine kinase CikA n=1 Tax=Paenibacillus piri TaxID=2547395 RepID=A0A4R5KN84_9BACL|nr:response regulator [Paenibacillus piri]TDF97119.1 response regulator [Paenibacillus piri]